MCLCLYVCVCVCSLCSVLCLHARVNIMNRLTNKISGNQFVLQNHEIHSTCQCRTLFMLYYPRCDWFSKEHTANTHHLFCFDFLGCMIVSCYFFSEGAPLSVCYIWFFRNINFFSFFHKVSHRLVI